MRLRSGQGHYDIPSVRVRDMGAYTSRGGQAVQGARRVQRVFPYAHTAVVFDARSRACGRVRARSGDGNARRRRGAFRKTRTASHFRNHNRQHVQQMDKFVSRSSAQAQSMGKRSALGKNDASVLAHERVPLARGAYRVRYARGGECGRVRDDGRLQTDSKRRVVPARALRTKV